MSRTRELSAIGSEMEPLENFKMAYEFCELLKKMELNPLKLKTPRI